MLASQLYHPQGKILSFIPQYRNKYPWECSLLGLALEVEIQNGDIQKINVFV